MESSGESYCLLITHELNRTGAPITLIDVARTLIKHGHYVIVCSSFDGPLREEFEALGCEVLVYRETMEVLIDPNYYLETRALLPLAARADIVFVNTIALYKLIDLFNDYKFPVLWWIHEGYYFSHNLRGLLPSKIRSSIKVLHAGAVNLGLLPKLGVDAPSDALLSFGVEDAYDPSAPHKNNDVFQFLCVGSLCSIKGQDILIDAVAHMQQTTDKPFEVLFAGSSNDEDIFNRMQEAIDQGLPVRYLGVISRDDILSHYHQADCVVAPSRTDTGPTVAAEAMMMSVPCMCSDACGASSFIETGINGAVVPSEDADALAQAMIDLMSLDQAARDNMGALGRKTYVEHYSMDAFEENLMAVINDNLAPAKPLKQVEDDWDALELQLDTKQAEIEHLQFVIKDIEESKSYKIMEPLRALNRKIHRL